MPDAIDPHSHLRLRPVLRYVAAATLVLLTVALRALMQPSLGSAFGFSTFYPVVVICAGMFGSRVAIFALLGALTASQLFFTPAGGLLHLPVSRLAAILLFGINSGVAIWLIASLRRSLYRSAAERRTAQALARSQLDLVRELNIRTAQHLQLVAGVLSLQAKGEPGQDVAEALRRAARQSLILARAHRRSEASGEATVDVSAQASQLVATTLAIHGKPAGSIVVEPSDLRLPPEQATSVAVALLECVEALSAEDLAAPVRITLSNGRDGLVLRLSYVDEDQGTSIITGPNGHLLRAALDQIQGRMWLVKTTDGCSMEMSFPRTSDQPPPAPAITTH